MKNAVSINKKYEKEEGQEKEEKEQQEKEQQEKKMKKLRMQFEDVPFYARLLINAPWTRLSDQ